MIFYDIPTDTDNDKLSGLPHSTTGSLSSIITTSIASSEPDPGAGGGGGNGDGNGHDASSNMDEKMALNRPGIKQEKWTTILLQVSIPFFLAGIGTIGAGIVLGRVEVSCCHNHLTNRHDIFTKSTYVLNYCRYDQSPTVPTSNKLKL